MENNNKGFSLVEVIIAVAILAVVSIPVIKIFIQTANIDSVSRQTQKATDIAQNIIEGVREYSMEEIIDQCMSVGKKENSLSFLTDWCDGYSPKGNYVSLENIEDDSSTIAFIESKYGTFDVLGNVSQTDASAKQGIAVSFKGSNIRFAIRGIQYPSGGMTYDAIVSFDVNKGSGNNTYELNGDTYYLYNVTVSVYQVVGASSVKRASLTGAVQNKPDADINVAASDEIDEDEERDLLYQNGEVSGHVVHDPNNTECSVVKEYNSSKKNNNSIKALRNTLAYYKSQKNVSLCSICFK